MSFIAYETPVDYEPDIEYVNEPRNTMEYYAWRIGINEKYALWVFQQAVEAPTQNLIDDILPETYQVVEIDDDLQKYGFFRTFMLDQSVAEVDDFLRAETDDIESLF